VHHDDKGRKAGAVKRAIRKMDDDRIIRRMVEIQQKRPGEWLTFGRLAWATNGPDERQGDRSAESALRGPSRGLGVPFPEIARRPPDQPEQAFSQSSGQGRPSEGPGLVLWVSRLWNTRVEGHGESCGGNENHGTQMNAPFRGRTTRFPKDCRQGSHS
jgi:hypothetical protein